MAGDFSSAQLGVGAIQSIGNVFVDRYFADARKDQIRAQNAFIQARANINARFAEMQARDILRQGDKASADHQKKVKQVVGSQRAALAAQGIEVSSDTALDLQREASETGALDAATIKNNAWRQAFGFKQEAIASRFQAEAAQLGVGQQLGQLDFAKKSSVVTGGLGLINQGLGFGASQQKMKKTT